MCQVDAGTCDRNHASSILLVSLSSSQWHAHANDRRMNDCECMQPRTRREERRNLICFLIALRPHKLCLLVRMIDSRLLDCTVTTTNNVCHYSTILMEGLLMNSCIAPTSSFTEASSLDPCLAKPPSTLRWILFGPVPAMPFPVGSSDRQTSHPPMAV